MPISTIKVWTRTEILLPYIIVKRNPTGVSFVTASVADRALRRWKELHGRGIAADLEQVRDDIRTRDAQDRNRPVAPLRAADDAVTIDTTAMDAEAAFAAAMEAVRARLGA